MSKPVSCIEQSCQSNPSQDGFAELFLDGVSYVAMPNAWRLGTLDPLWREKIVALGHNPSAESLKHCADQGMYLHTASSVLPLALMCQGMGALWPGAGRELYDEFPLAREAMDRIQSVASWDVLSLMDEEDPAKINATRWQIPYLFLLEYAQWAYLSSLGLEPSLMLGHSLGELIALCCSGIYTPEIAWHILDTRAEHVSTLESRAKQDYGMLAIHAGWDIVSHVLATWPEVRVANFNTPTQYIVVGSKSLLHEIRGILRKQRIPAVSISVSLLFHHPQMRILRDHSLMRLNMLAMHAPKIPVLSVSKIIPYPDTQDAICRYIADLDENPVRFSESLTLMWDTYQIRTFLEIGPQDVLSGLIAANLPKAQVLSCGRKGKEALALRELCAQLYAMGYLREQALSRAKTLFPHHVSKPVPMQPMQSMSSDQEEAAPVEALDSKTQQLLALLTKVTGIAPIHLSDDLRHDLAVRSSSFPSLLRDAEALFDHIPSFEDLLRVVTVGDLLRVFLGKALPNTPHPLYPRTEILPRLCRMEKRAGKWMLTSFARPHVHTSTEALGVVIESGLTEPWLRLLIPDLFVGLFGLVGRIVVDAANYPLVKRLCTDTLAPLPLEQGDVEACDRIVHLCLGGTESEPVSHKKPWCLLRLWKECPTEDALTTPAAGRVLDCILEQFRRHFHIVGQLFALELGSFAQKAHVLWLEEALCQRFAPNPPLLPPLSQSIPTHLPSTLIPHRLAPGIGCNTYAARVFFSRDGDPWLKDVPTLPFVRVLETVCAAAHELSPWLHLAGLSDLQFGVMPQLYDGIVRTAELCAHEVGWVHLKGVITRQVQAHLLCDDLLPSGRRSPHQSLCVSGTLILAKDKIPFPHFGWDEMALRCSTPHSFASWVGPDSPRDWHLLETVLFDSEDTLIVQPKPPVPCVALALEKEYGTSLFLFACAIQAAQSFLARKTRKTLSLDEQAGVWTLVSVGFVFFAPAVREWGTPTLIVHAKQSAAQFGEENPTEFPLARFDIKATDALGQTLLTVSQLQFEFVQIPSQPKPLSSEKKA